MITVPLTLADANAFVTLHHRHNKKVQAKLKEINSRP